MLTTSTPAPNDAAARLLRLSALENEAYGSRRLHVLVVDDNHADAAVLAALLGDSARVTTAATLKAAFDALGAHEDAADAPDCVLLDLGLPDTATESADAVAAIATRHPRIPVLVITGQEDDGLAMEAVAAGAQDVLVKGAFDGPDLLRRIRFAAERKRVWWSVVRADRRHRRILERAGVGVWLGTSDGETTYVNTRLAGLLGLDANDLIGHALTSVVARGDHDTAKALLDEAVGTHAFVSLVRADGSSLPVSLTVSRAEDEPNELVAFVTDLRGVHAADHVDHVDHDHGHGAAALVDKSWDIISVHDRQGRIQWTSAAATKLLGVPAGGAAAGMSMIDRIDPDDVERENDAVRAWRVGDACTVAYRVVDGTGALRHVESVGSNMLDHPGIGGIVVTTRDVTDR
ncbi:MAG TPA: PAS domain S-box protein, partial [Acidimicrobiales bacterium]